MNKEKKSVWESFINVGKLDSDKKEKVVICFLLGVFLMLVATPIKDGRKKLQNKVVKNKEEVLDAKPESKKEINNAYLSYMENKLEQTIGGMDGAGRVFVMITLKDDGQKILDKNLPYESQSETGKEDGKEVKKESMKSEQQTVLIEQDGNTGPIVVKEQYPDIEGVVVLCEGGNNEAVALKIKEAVSALFSIDSHKIVVGKLKNGSN
ncbi:MAG: hypothetical protein K6G76_02085 [Lachnospiraceae bacterium]|nr:hypothetical protein [Lachnospiraceae bacterium]